MPPVTTWKKHMGTITFLTLPENFFVVLLFYCSWGKISQSEWTFWAYFQRTLVPRKTVFLRKLCARKVQVIEDGLWAQYNNLQGLVFIPDTRNYCFWIWNRKEKINTKQCLVGLRMHDQSIHSPQTFLMKNVFFLQPPQKHDNRNCFLPPCQLSEDTQLARWQ